ncbi:MAG: glycerophosphodiester phosphodiesterase family protein [Verrucomicrobiales bacterium]|nr:glycerophosphodiester phosphodiesterase family protein [Verrucomicrobiales bacterium]
MKTLIVFVGMFVFAGAVQTAPSASEKVLGATKNGVVLIAAHRGGYTDDVADQAPENSVANVAVAIHKGYDVFETDIQRTSDGVFVAVHDPTLERETDGSGEAKDLTLAQLKSLKKRYRDGTLSGERVATLEELLLAGKGKILFKPDLKPGVIDHFDQLARLIKKLGMQDQVFIRTGMENFKVIQAYFEGGGVKVEVMFKVKKLKQLKSVIKTFHPKTVQVDLREGEGISNERKAVIREAVRSGLLVETHAYKDSTQWAELADLGVRMFHTKKPDVMLVYLKDNGWRKGEKFEG